MQFNGQKAGIIRKKVIDDVNVQIAANGQKIGVMLKDEKDIFIGYEIALYCL
jgi:hypothetical protein